MSNETMPETNIDANTDWTKFPEKIRIYRENSIDEDHWDDAAIDPDSEEVLYQRFDTIPSKAEVAREFIEAVSGDLYEGIRMGGLILKMHKVLKEWEDAEGK